MDREGSGELGRFLSWDGGLREVSLDIGVATIVGEDCLRALMSLAVVADFGAAAFNSVDRRTVCIFCGLGVVVADDVDRKGETVASFELAGEASMRSRCPFERVTAAATWTAGTST